MDVEEPLALQESLERQDQLESEETKASLVLTDTKE